MPDYPENPGSLPAPYLKNKSGGGKGLLGRPDICPKDAVIPGCDPGIYGPDKDGVDGGYGSFTKAAVNDLQEKNRDQKELIGHLDVQ